jgi:hypothetical protein
MGGAYYFAAVATSDDPVGKRKRQPAEGERAAMLNCNFVFKEETKERQVGGFHETGSR